MLAPGGEDHRGFVHPICCICATIACCTCLTHSIDGQSRLEPEIYFLHGFFSWSEIQNMNLKPELYFWCILLARNWEYKSHTRDPNLHQSNGILAQLGLVPNWGSQSQCDKLTDSLCTGKFLLIYLFFGEVGRACFSCHRKNIDLIVLHYVHIYVFSGCTCTLVEFVGFSN